MHCYTGKDRTRTFIIQIKKMFLSNNSNNNRDCLLLFKTFMKKFLPVFYL